MILLDSKNGVGGALIKHAAPLTDDSLFVQVNALKVLPVFKSAFVNWTRLKSLKNRSKPEGLSFSLKQVCHVTRASGSYYQLAVLQRPVRELTETHAVTAVSPSRPQSPFEDK